MDTQISEIAAVLRSTEDMATKFAERIQERLGRSVTHAEILAVMGKIPSHSLTMDKVINRLRRQKRNHS